MRPVQFWGLIHFKVLPDCAPIAQDEALQGSAVAMSLGARVKYNPVRLSFGCRLQATKPTTRTNYLASISDCL